MQRIDDTLETLREAYLKRRRNLVRFFTARLGSAVAAEELVREILVKLPALKPAEAGQDPAALLYRIGADILAQRATPRGQAQPVQYADDPSIPTGEERLDQLAAAIEALPPRTREAFRLHRLEGLTLAETAQAMGVSESMVEKHVGGALKALLPRLT